MINTKTLTLDELTMTWGASTYNQELKLQIEAELKRHITTNTRFCKEDFVQQVHVQKKVTNVTFIPTSDSYNEHGRNVTIVKLLLSDDEKVQLLENLANSLPTYGEIAGTTHENKQIIFNTRDVLEIANR